MELALHLLSGAVGGNLLGALTKAKVLVSTLMGLLGGGVGHFFGESLLKMIGAYSDFGAAGEYGLSGALGAILGIVGRFVGGGKKKRD